MAAILGNIEQTMFDESLYASRELKAAHLLYFIIKDHPFGRQQAHRVPALCPVQEVRDVLADP